MKLVEPRLRRTVAFLVAVPDRFLLFAMCAMLATAVTVQLSIFHPYTVFPLFVVLAAVSWKLTPGPLLDPAGAAAGRTSRVTGSPARRWQLIGSLAAVVITLAWILLQRQYHSELLSVRRDPSIYTLRGFWLMNHPGPDVYLSQQLLDIKKAVPTVGLDFGSETGDIIRYFQSTTVVPGLIAIVGWIGGPSALLQGNVLIGGATLLCLYAVARRMAGPLFGLVPVVAMACCMPLAAFSRVAYTEPLSLIALLACLLGLWEAARTGRRSMWLLAGLGAGAVVVARIDGWIVVIGGLVAIGIWGAATTSRAMRRNALVALGLFCLGAFPMAALGFADLHFHSPDYIVALKASLQSLVVGTAAATVIAVVVIALPGVRGIAEWLRLRSRSLGTVVVVVAAVAMLFVIARPLLFVVHASSPVPVVSRQKAEGLPIDPTRSYDEQSLHWISWYFGWPAVVLGCLAGLLAIRRGIRDRFTPIVLVTVVVAVSAVLYLNFVNITPDQIWAMRRFLPVILPGGLLLIAWALHESFERRAGIAALIGRILPARPELANGRVVTGLAVVCSLVVALYPVTTWGPMFTIREGAGQLAMVQQVCAKISNQKVLLIGPNPAMGYYQPTFRNLCGATVITVPNSVVRAGAVTGSTAPSAAAARLQEKTKIAKVMKLWGVTSVRVVSFASQSSMTWTRDPGAPFATDSYQMWESVISRRPAEGVDESTRIWLGTANPDGSVVPG